MASLNYEVDSVSAANREKLLGALESAEEASISLQIKYASEPKNATNISKRSLKSMVQKKLTDVKAVVDDQAFDVAVALWEYQYVVDGDNELWFGHENIKLGLDVTLIERAQAFLHHWRLLIKSGERISCPHFMDEFEDGDASSALIKLYRATVLQLAHEGETIRLANDSSTETHDYTLQETEKAIFVHYVGYSREQDRWHLIKKGDYKAKFIVPQDAHESVVIALTSHNDKGGHEKKPATSLRPSNGTFSSFGEAKSSSVAATHSELIGGNNITFIIAEYDLSTESISKPSTETKRKFHETDLDAPIKSLDNRSHMSNAETTEIVDNVSIEYESNVQTLRTRGGTAKLGETNGNGGTPSRISRKRRATTIPDPTTVEKKGRGQLAPKDKEDDMLWICTECREAECMEDPHSNLIICDGKCNRAFHFHCCGISEDAVTSVESWICADCTNKKHRCAVCQEYGNDDDDVFLCEKKKCGMFFHESCLRMQNIDVRLVGVADTCGEPKEALASDDGIVSATRPVFTCPAHSCWTCTEDYIPEEEGEEEGKSKSLNGRGKGRKKLKRNGNFLSKNDRLYRCMVCPIAYHVSCFPPTARFHELAILCHEHSSSHKLPDLDMATSLQCKVEAVIDKKIEKLLQDKSANCIQKTANTEHANGDVFNAFFSGVRGDGVTSDEAMLAERLDSDMLEDSAFSLGRLSFCLPCDFKEEVHSKPPHYKHVHSLRYDPMNKPKRKAATGETCECHKSGQKLCDENCYNRMTMMECVGDKDKGNGEKNLYWNCNLGPTCGNRKMSQRATAKCKPKREKGKGWGLISIDGIKQGGLVQEYVGEVVDEKTKEGRLVEWSKEHPNDPNYYLMQLEPGWYIDARLEANLSRFINHSCEPNCHLVQMNVNGFARVGVFALKDIAPGEFLSYDYQFDTKDGDKFVCRCGASKCRGTMKGGKHKTVDEPPKSAKELWREAKAKYDRDAKFLEEVEKVEVARFSQVDITVPGAEFSHEMVASGPLRKNMGSNTRPKIFLWRNAVIGSDFAARSRRESKRTSRPRGTHWQVPMI